MASVLLGMSGGVDSSVAALRLMEEGYDVCGTTFVMHDSHLSAANDAKRVADAIGIPHTVADLRDEFERYVLSPFVAEYEKGRTPNPCVLCNKHIKFPTLLALADERGLDFIATGHYASIVNRGGFNVISAASDKAKDQSYFLYTLGQDILSRLIFPISDLTKPEIRNIASEHALPCAASPDSQDICFISDISCADFVASRMANKPRRGNFIDTNGNILGTHKGIWAYTVGQRKGLGISSVAPLYVGDIDPISADITLCRDPELYRSRVYVNNCVYYTGKLPDTPFTARICLRYTRRSAVATVTPISTESVRLDFYIPQRAPAPGQSAVFFDSDELLGGGIIEYSEP